MNNKVFILIPAYNEESTIGQVLDSLKVRFKNIIVVNDGSTDETQSIIEKKDVIIIRHTLNLGQGAAISSGMNYLKNKNTAEALITFDADGQHSVEDAVSFAKEIIKSDEEIIFGSRFIKNKANIPYLKRIILKAVTLITNLLTNTRLSDTHNGLKAIKVSCLNKISITIDGFAFESQIIQQINKKKIRYKEMPTNTIYTDYSKRKGQKLLNGLIILEDLIKSIKLK